MNPHDVLHEAMYTLWVRGGRRRHRFEPCGGRDGENPVCRNCARCDAQRGYEHFRVMSGKVR